VKDMMDREVADAMQRCGAGEITAAQAAAEIAPAPAYATAERDARTAESNEYDPDDASTPTAFMGLALAYSTGVISAEQYSALSHAIVARSNS
jgi:hypothetical protein